MIRLQKNPTLSTGSQISSKGGDISENGNIILVIIKSRYYNYLCCTCLLVFTHMLNYFQIVSMNWMARLLVSQLVLMLDWVQVQADKLNAAQCLEKGFNSAKLLCSSCEDLKQFDLSKVAQDCVQCCVSDGGSANLENTKYEKAILEVCG